MGPSCSDLRFLEAKSYITGCCKVDPDFRGGAAARRPRGLKSEICMHGSHSLAPNTLLLLPTDKGVYGVVGSTTCPNPCFFCNARVLAERFSLTDTQDECLMYYE